jgi:hypothetical protein
MGSSLGDLLQNCPMRSYYEVLGLEKKQVDDDPSCVKVAYKKLALESHPDKTGADGEEFRNISRAYKVLSNEELRIVSDTFFPQRVQVEEVLEQSKLLFPGMDTRTAVGIMKILIPQPSMLHNLSLEELQAAIERAPTRDFGLVSRILRIVVGLGYLYLLIRMASFS